MKQDVGVCAMLTAPFERVGPAQSPALWPKPVRDELDEIARRTGGVALIEAAFLDHEGDESIVGLADLQRTTRASLHHPTLGFREFGRLESGIATGPTPWKKVERRRRVGGNRHRER